MSHKRLLTGSILDSFYTLPVRVSQFKPRFAALLLNITSELLSLSYYFRRVANMCLLTIILFIANSPWIKGATFTGLGKHTTSTAISADGKTIIGFNWSGPFKWNPQNGISYLQSSSSISRPLSTSYNGSIIVGYDYDTKSNIQIAVKWNSTLNQTLLGFEGEAMLVRPDGSGIVVRDFKLNQVVVKYDSREKYILDYDINHYMTGWGGNTIVGYCIIRDSWWSETWPPISSLGSSLIIHAISADGLVLVGKNDHTSSAELWSQKDWYTDLNINIDYNEPYSCSVAYGVNKDGTLVVGTGSKTNCLKIGLNKSIESEAFLWDRTNHMRSLKSVLKSSHGINLTNWVLATAIGISNDGKSITGMAINPNGESEGYFLSFDDISVPLSIQYPCSINIDRKLETLELDFGENIGYYTVYHSQLLKNIDFNGVSIISGVIPENKHISVRCSEYLNDGQSYFQLAINPEACPRTNSVKKECIWIPPGSYIRGNQPIDYMYYDQLKFKSTPVCYGFWICRHEVTQAEYLKLIGHNPSYFNWGDLSMPVENVSYQDATNYCVQLTLKERLLGSLPSGYVYRLPTNIEWEYVYQSGISIGSENYGSSGNRELGWDLSNSGWITHSVETMLPNAWGLYDMYGNVEEYCGDFPVKNELVVSVKGGSFKNDSWGSVVTNVAYIVEEVGKPSPKASYRGFRVVLGLP